MLEELAITPSKAGSGVDGWHSDSPIFKHVVETVSPNLIVEVGTWKGKSAIEMMRWAKPTTTIICVDTWLGSLEHWMNEDMELLYGRPTLYIDFLKNIREAQIEEQVRPLPMPSKQAARFLKWKWDWVPKADLIYIDGSHDEQDVLSDLVEYWPLVQKGGIMFGDDYGEWQTVEDAVEKFVQGRTDMDFRLKDYTDREECFWIMEKIAT